MIEVDGGEGGGQLVRSAVAMAALTGRSVRIENVRGNRREPGLKHQHLAAVAAVADCCGAEVEGATLGSETVTLDPGPVEGGDISVEIPTAGSVTLVFDAVLPLALALDGPLRIEASGGTDVAWSPSSCYYGSVKLPLLARHGLVAALDVTRHGFYPQGGGRAALAVAPATMDRIDLRERGDCLGARVASLCSQDLADADVADRQASAALDRLRAAGVETLSATTSRVEAPSSGSAVLVRLDYADSLAGFTALGEPGRPAEEVGERATEDALAFERGGAVDPYMADQLLPFLAVAGGRIAVPAVTDHVASHLGLLRAFGFEVDCEERAETVLLRSPGRALPDG